MDSTVQQLKLPSIFTDSDFYKIEIKQSKIPGAGKGIFATQAINANQYITEYYGIVIPTKYGFIDPFLMQNKMLYVSEDYCIISRAPGSLANDIIKWQPEHFMSPQNQENRKNKQLNCLQGLNRNATIKLVSKDKAFLMATRSIAPQQQIYVDYGFEYWQFFFQNDKSVKKDV